MPIKLIVGLGNPGKKYESTRHNAGFWLLERLAAQHRLTLRKEAKFTHWWPGSIPHPGRLAAAAADLDERIGHGGCCARAVPQDRGRRNPGGARRARSAAGGVKIKQGGGHAGHNGLRDIIEKLGAPDFWRLRIGIGHPRDVAASEQEVVDFVLHPPRKEEQR